MVCSDKKAVFFDLDGTIWDWRRNIPESTVYTIKKLKENDHKVLLCSGRARGNIRAQKVVDLGFDGIVAACGGYVEIGGKVLDNFLIPKDVVKLTVDTINECRMPVVLEGPKKHWISDWGFENDSFVAFMREDMKKDAVSFSKYSKNMKINKFSADVLGVTDYVKIKKQLEFYYKFIEHGITPDFAEKKKTDDSLDICGVIEATPLGISKAVGVRKACEYLGVKIENTYGIGDSVNDIDLFECVAHSICMGNGAEKAKEAAEYVTTDIQENGIYNAMKHYELI